MGIDVPRVRILGDKGACRLCPGPQSQSTSPRFESTGEPAGKVRVHVAAEHLQNVLYHVQTFPDHNLIEYVPMTAAEALAHGTRLTSLMEIES
jgi:hypothetical protein